MNDATQPWLSVLMPVYNGQAYLALALDSIVAQRDPGIEVIAVDDGSTDETRAILRRYADKLSLRIVEREHIGNWAANTNVALRAAKGSYVCILHQDDVWETDRASRLKSVTEKSPDIDLILSPTWFIDRMGRRLGLWRCPLPSYPQRIQRDDFKERLLVQNFIAVVSAVFKRELTKRVGGLDETLWYTPDWDLWLKLAAEMSGGIAYLPTPLASFRIHASSQTLAGAVDSDDFRRQLETVLSRHLDAWDVPEGRKRSIARVGEFSIESNLFLAKVNYGRGGGALRLTSQFLSLGPPGWFRYFRDSRIGERASARLKAKLRGR